MPEQDLGFRSNRVPLPPPGILFCPLSSVLLHTKTQGLQARGGTSLANDNLCLSGIASEVKPACSEAEAQQKMFGLMHIADKLVCISMLS